MKTEKIAVNHSYLYPDLMQKSVGELRTIIRQLKGEGQNNMFANKLGMRLVKFSKEQCCSLIMGDVTEMPALDNESSNGELQSESQTSTKKESSTQDKTEAIDLLEMMNNKDMNKSTPRHEIMKKTEPKLNLSGGLGALESYFIELVKQHSTAKIDSTQIEKQINDVVGPLVEQLKRGVTTNIELTRYDGSKIKLDTVHKDTEKCLQLITTRDIVNNKRIHLFLSGGAGGGKTTLAKIIANLIGVNFYPMSVCGMTTESKLIGYKSPIDNQYKMTPLGNAVKFGGLGLIDEVDTSNSNVLNVLNAMLSNDCVMMDNELVNIHPDFYCIVAGNTTGYGANRKYVGRNPLDGAFLDRFAFWMLDYDEQLELKLSGNPEWCKRVQAIRKAVDELKMQFIVSPRASISGGMLLARKDQNDKNIFTRAEVEDVLIFNKIGTENKDKIIAHLGGK